MITETEDQKPRSHLQNLLSDIYEDYPDIKNEKLSNLLTGYDYRTNYRKNDP